MNGRVAFLSWVLLAISLWSSASCAELPEDALEKRLSALSAELRCLVCQNQSLADSHAELAIDLKNQVKDMMRAGKSDEEIKAYLTQRYGDFVLYRPPVKSSTWLLWIGPFVLMAGGMVVLVRVMRRRETRAESPSPGDMDAGGARERARVLLEEPDGPGR